MNETSGNGGDRQNQRLGRGLAALIGELDPPASAQQTPKSEPAIDVDRNVPIETIRPNPNNPRRSFAEEELDDLANSLRSHGVVQPVVVRSVPPKAPGEPGYEIIAGERRWRAAQRAGLANVPIVVRQVDDREALELAIVENVQRSDLNAIEEADGYRQLIDAYAYTQNELSSVVGKSRSHVANTLRLLNLPFEVRALVVQGDLTSGHARALVSREDALPMARRIVSEGLSVRQTENLVKEPETADANGDVKSGTERRTRQDAAGQADRAALEKQLTEWLGMKVTVSMNGSGEAMRGQVKIAYRSLDQLDDICERLQRSRG